MAGFAIATQLAMFTGGDPGIARAAGRVIREEPHARERGFDARLVQTSMDDLSMFAAGEFDMSFGSTLAWATTLSAVLTVNEGWSFGPALVVVLLSCLLIGAINAFFIVYIGISSLIATLGSGTVIIGFTLAVSQSQVLTGPPEVLTTLTTGDLFGLPYPVYLGLVLAAVQTATVADYYHLAIYVSGGGTVELPALRDFRGAVDWRAEDPARGWPLFSPPWRPSQCPRSGWPWPAQSKRHPIGWA